MSVDPVTLAITAGLTAANMALTMSKKIEGPRLDNLDVSVGDYGAPLSRIYGKRRVEGCPIIWCEPIRIEKQESKTKGGKISGDIAYGTWAVSLAYNEIAACSRLWADKHLVLDLTGAGPVTPFPIGHTSPGFKGGSEFHGISFADHVTFYLGTETQEVDPRILAWSEENFGEGSATAYRGMAYAVFKDVPLEKFGNRVPQIAAEVLSASVPHYPYESFDILDSNLSRLWGATFSPDFSRFMWASPASYEIWDVAARARMISGTLPGSVEFQKSVGLYNDGRFLMNSLDNSEVYEFSPDGMTVATIYTAASAAAEVSGLRVVADGNGNEHWCALNYSSNAIFVFDGTVIDPEDLTGVKWTATTCFADDEGSVWVGGGGFGIGATTAYFYRMISGSDATGPGFVTVSGLPATASVIIDVTALQYGDTFVFHWGFGSPGNIYTANRLTGALVDSNTAITVDPYNIAPEFNAVPVGASSMWIQNKEISLADLSVIRTVTLNNWTTEDADGIIFDPRNHALITSPADDEKITWRYLDRVGGDTILLGDIAADVSTRAGVTDYDFSDLDQEVPGWSIAGIGQASNQIEPLFSTYDSDIRLHNFTVEGIKRHGVTGGTLYTERFVAGDERYSLRLRQSRELPLAITVNFADVNADQQPNNVRCPLPIIAKDAQGEQQLDLGTWAGTADEARALGDRYLRREWNQRREVSLSLTAQQLALEPGDVRTLDLDGEQWTARLTKLTIQADGVLSTEWKYDDPHLATLGGLLGAEMDGRPETVIAAPLLSKGFALDIPLIADIDNSLNPVIYNAAAPYADGTWPGAALWQATDGEYSDEIASTGSNAQAVWGYATEALPDANPWVWDRGSSVNVVLQVGTLTGTTEVAIDAGPTTNMALLGDEIINFTTATLEGDGSYTLSGFKRGRRGTEWACGTHADRDVFLLLDTANAVELGLSDVGTELSFKEITSGRTESGAFPITLDPFTGASLKPYAPCHLEAVKESNGDWTLTWVRRTRVGGAWTSGTSIPLSEASEEYEVTVGDGVDESTATVTSPTYTWTLAAQTTLTGGEVLAGDLVFSVAQVSDAVGAGFLAEATA